MANLTEGAVWESGIYRIETTDAVIGGELGISNKQAKQLANRTSYLKSITDTLTPTAFINTVSNGGPILERQATGGDLDDILSQGLFYCLSADNAPATIGFLWVGFDAPECSQIFHATSDTDKSLYIRSREGDPAAWSAWKRLLTEDDEANFLHRSNITPSNYNDVLTAGQYTITNQSAISNSPIPAGATDQRCMLLVAAGTNHISQTLIYWDNQYSASILVYNRVKRAGTWSSWATCVTASTLKQKIDDVFVGAVQAFACSTAPTGWIECDGRALYSLSYPALYERIGTTFGSGEPPFTTTNFNIPDLRGQFIRGWDSLGLTDPGRTFGSPQMDEFEAHTHDMTYNTNQPSNTSSGTSMASSGGDTYSKNTGSTGEATETRPKNIALMYCIYTGVE